MRSLHRQHLDRFLASAIPSTPGLRGLHIGCGRGARGDYRPAASQRWIDADLAGGHVTADVHRLPFRSASFDVVRATEMLYHVDPGQIRHALGECRRVLRSGGRFVMTVPLLVPPINPDDLTRLTPNGWHRLLPFSSVTITALGGYYSHLVITLEHLWRGFAALRPLAWLDTEAYPHALGIVATA